MGAQKKTKTWKSVWCHELGHFLRDCPKLKNLDSLGPAHMAETAEEKELDSDSDADGVFVTAIDSGGSSQTGKRLVDSGASSHMTQEKELLTDYHKF